MQTSPANFGFVPDGNTYRAVYTVRFTSVIYALHVFQKKAKHGIATPKRELELIKQRLRRAEEDYRQWQQENVTQLLKFR